MPKRTRHSTRYPGVFYVDTVAASGRPDHKFYIRYRKNSKLVEEPVGYATRGMTAAKASVQRSRRIEGKELTNKELRVQKEEARLAKSRRWPFDRLWSHYLEHKSRFKGQRRDSTIYLKHIQPAFGDKEPQELAPFDVQAFRVKLERKHLAPQSVKNILALLRRLALYGEKNALCPGLKFRIQMPEHINNTVTDFLDSDDARRVLAACESHPNIQGANLVKLALFTGLRASELFSLEWGHVDFAAGHIKIVDSKSGKDQRIPMNAMARQLLENHPRTPGSPYVFPGRNGNCRKSVAYIARAIRAAAGLPKHIRPLHDLRHAFASLLASSGKVTLYELQALLRHSDPRVTQRYAHLVDTTLQRAAGVLDGVLFGERQPTRRVIRR